jgi:hypothetical protein
MRNLVPTALALAVTLGTGMAVAQTGQADQAGARTAPAEKTTKEERSQARKQRLSETARENKAGELSPGGEASGAPAASTKKYSKSERQAARKERLDESAKENKSGQIRSGER